MSPFTLTPSRDDTGVYQDARIGFSHLLPGRPTLGRATRAGDPPADAAIHLQDAPITIRYRMEAPPFAASSAAELALGSADRYAAWRAQAPVVVDAANESWFAAWGVEAAAVAAYDVPPDERGDVSREDLFVLVRSGIAAAPGGTGNAVFLVSWTYPRGFVDDPAYATFASVAEATMIWDAARSQEQGRVWPDGAFLGPGLFGAPMPKYKENARQLSAAPMLPQERIQVLSILSSIVSGAGAPWVVLTPDVIDHNKRLVLSAVRNGRLRAFLEEAFLDVHTAHDLRGLAIVVGRALDGRRASSPSMPATHAAV